MTQEFVKGTLVYLPLNFVNASDRSAVDPSEIILRVRKPTGDITTYNWPADPEVIFDDPGIGEFHAQFVGDVTGAWAFDVDATGAAAGVEDGSFRVRNSLVDTVWSALADVDQLKARLNDRGGKTDDDVLWGLLKAASNVMEQVRLFHPDPPPGDDPVTRTVRLDHARMIRVPDVRSLTAIDIDGASVDPNTVRLVGRDNEPAYHLYLPAGVVSGEWMELTGHFGFQAPPEEVVQAVLTLAQRAYHERNARQADTVQDPEGGVYAYFRQIPPSVEQVRAYHRIPGL